MAIPLVPWRKALHAFRLRAHKVEGPPSPQTSLLAKSESMKFVPPALGSLVVSRLRSTDPSCDPHQRYRRHCGDITVGAARHVLPMLSLLLVAIVGLSLGACDSQVKTGIAPEPLVGPSVSRDIGAGGTIAGECYSHEIVYDYGIGAWHDNTAQPNRYYDLDPYADCDGGGSRFTPSWGNEYGDGGGFLYWDLNAQFGPDQFKIAEDAMAACPFCPIGQVEIVVEEAPGIAEEAALAGESALGYSSRLVNAYNNIGPTARAQYHHIFTDKNFIAGEQWSIRFRDAFASVGMKLSDQANRVLVWDHVGPHPQAYHDAVWARITSMLNAGGGLAGLKSLLAQLAEEVSTPGTELNDMITTH